MAFNMIELAMGFASILPGIIAIHFTTKARRNLSNSWLRTYMKYIIWAMLSLSLFSVWYTSRQVFGLKEIYGFAIEVPEYLLVILTCFLFLVSSWTIFKMSKEYGFK